jgi:WD40 repeat protein
VNRDATRALLWNASGATVYDLTAGHELHAFDIDPVNETTSIWMLSSDGSRVAELGMKRVRVFDADSGTVVLARDVPEGSGPGGDISRDGRRLVLAASTPVVWQLPGGEPVAMKELEMMTEKHVKGRTIFTSTGPNDVVYDPTGARMLTLWTSTPVVADSATGDTVRRLDNWAQVDAGTLDDGGHHAITQAVGATTVWNIDTGTMLFSVPGTSSGAFAISHDGARIATGHPDGTIQIWDASGRLLEAIHGHRSAIVSLQFSDDNSRLVALGGDRWTSVWDVHLERRSAADITAIAHKLSEWDVVGGTLVTRKVP